MGRSRGGLTTKIHMLCDALGLPLKFVVTGGQRSDYTEALTLLRGERSDYLVADKGYDSQEIAKHVEDEMKAEVVIPTKINRKKQRLYDKTIYKERNLIERLFNKLKHFRRIATRYDKIKLHFESFVSLACAWIWLS